MSGERVIPMRRRKNRRFYMGVESDECFVGPPPKPGDVVEFVCIDAKPNGYWFCLRVKHNERGATVSRAGAGRSEEGNEAGARER